MALYVWYDGHNLAENFGIVKNSLKTDSDNEIDESAFEDNIENIEKIDPNVLAQYEEDSAIGEVIQFIEDNSKFINSSQLKDQIRITEANKLNAEMMMNPVLKKAYCANYGIEENMIQNNNIGSTVELPYSLFLNDDVDETMYEFDENTGELVSKHSLLAGNLSNYWDQI
jgi:hypothetical protein